MWGDEEREMKREGEGGKEGGTEEGEAQRLWERYRET